MPLVWSGEDGDYSGEGHIDPAAFKAAAHAHDMECLGEDHDCEWGECSAEMVLDDVSHEWWYPIDPTNDETAYRPCDPDHPDAKPWTIWRR